MSSSRNVWRTVFGVRISSTMLRSSSSFGALASSRSTMLFSKHVAIQVCFNTMNRRHFAVVFSQFQSLVRASHRSFTKTSLGFLSSNTSTTLLFAEAISFSSDDREYPTIEVQLKPDASTTLNEEETVQSLRPEKNG